MIGFLHPVGKPINGFMVEVRNAFAYFGNLFNEQLFNKIHFVEVVFAAKNGFGFSHLV